jgi:hypothetical protein
MGILESQRLWATDYRHLNDSSELNHARSILQTQLFQKIFPAVKKIYSENSGAKEIVDKNGGIDRFSAEEAKDTIDILWKALIEMGPLFTVPCLSSFCLSEINSKYLQGSGLMSQWRGYGPDGGYAVVFNFSEMIKCFEEEDKNFIYAGSGNGDVCYECDALNKQHNLFSHLDCVITFASKLYSYKVYNTNPPQVEKQDLESLMHCLGRFKHRGFAEEREYRFFVFVYDDEEAVRKSKYFDNTNKPFKRIRSRLYQGTSVPYVELFETVQRLPIERIIVGPHKDKEERVESLKIYLKGKGLSDIKVDCSEIPYIGQHI